MSDVSDKRRACDREDFDGWHLGLYRGHHADITWAAWQAATAHERERIQDAISVALQGDLENGVKWLNEAASCKFRKEYPALAKLIGDGLVDGRARKGE